MLEYDRIDISEGIDIKKCKGTSRECSLCKFYYFLDKNFSYGPYLCNGCNDMSLKVINMKNLAIINHNGNIIVLILRLWAKKMHLIQLKYYKVKINIFFCLRII